MQSVQKHININTKNLQGSIFFRTFKYFLAQHSTVQHSLNQLIFSLLLFCGLFSFANQNENTTSLYVNPNTTIVGLNYLNHSSEISNQENELVKLYIVENTIFFSTHDFTIVTLKKYDEFLKVSEKNISKVSKKHVEKTNQQVVKIQSKAQVTQTPLPFSLPIEQKKTMVSAVSITTVTPSPCSKIVSKAAAIHNSFLLSIRKVLSRKQNATCYNLNSKPFKVKIKHFNRPPPVFYC